MKNLTIHNLDKLELVRFGDVGIGAEALIPSELGGRMSASVIELAPNEEFEPHKHSSDHVLMILEGSGRLDCWEGEEKSSYEVSKGDIVPVPSEFTHAFGAGREGCIFLSFATPARVLTDPERLRYV